MRLSIGILSSILITASSVSASSAVKYQNVGYSGTYKDVVLMDDQSCACETETVSFSGTNSPFNEELSVHIRGPLKLLQFGVYYPSSSSSKKKRESKPDPNHVHHQHKRAVEVEFVTSTITIDGKGNVLADPTPTSEPVPVTSSSQAAAPEVASFDTSSESTSEDQNSNKVASVGSTDDSTGGGWSRTSYYTPGSADNLVFLNHLGGSASGSFSTCFGLSLSYASSSGTSAASSPQVLAETTLGSDEEIIIFSGAKCSDGNSGCGYYREGIPAYHGFGGAEKIFVFEYTMPSDSGSSADANVDAPAIWLLNAKIPRTTQYAACSCWKSGCGELDVFEIITSGSGTLISQIHGGQGQDGTNVGGGGFVSAFSRPFSTSFYGAVVFKNDGTITIAQLDSATFGSSLSDDTVQSWLDISSVQKTSLA